MAVFSFYLADFPDGGTGTAVLFTADRLIKSGNKVFIYTPRHHQNNYPSDFHPEVEVVTVPPSDSYTKEHLDFLCQHIIAHQVSSMVVVAMRSFPFAEIRERTSCKMVYALHGRPFYEEHDINLQKRIDSKHSIGMWISYCLIQRWRYEWFHRSRQKVLPFYRETIKACDRFVVLCDEYAEMIAKELRLSPEDSKKLKVIPNGIVPKMPPCLEKEKIILFIGRLTPEDKRPMRLVKIWASIYKKLPDWRFQIVGDGPMKKTMEETIRKHGIQRMEFVGYSNNVVDYYQKASIVSLTSQYEGWPLCLAEGQTYGVVPIAFSCTAGIRDIINHPGENGILVPPYNCRTYAKRLLRLALDESKLAFMRAKVIEKSKEYDMARNSKGYQRLLEELL